MRVVEVSKIRASGAVVLLALVIAPGCSVFSGEKVSADVMVDDEAVPVEASSDEQSQEGVRLLRNKEWNRAIGVLTEVVRRRPTDHQSHFALGVAYEATGRFKEATAHYDEAGKLEKNDADYTAAYRRAKRKAGG